MHKPSPQTLKALRTYYQSCLDHLVSAAKRYPKDLDLDYLLMGHKLSEQQKQLIIKHVRRKACTSSRSV